MASRGEPTAGACSDARLWRSARGRGLGRPSDPQRPTAAGRAARARLARIMSIRRPATSPPATHDPVLRPSDAPTRHFAGRSGRPPPAVGVDPPISSSRPYHLEAASPASSAAPRRSLGTPKYLCGPNHARGWQRSREVPVPRIAATPAAPSPPAQSSFRPVAAPSYLPRRLACTFLAPRDEVLPTVTRRFFATKAGRFSSPRRRLGPPPSAQGPGVRPIDRS